MHFVENSTKNTNNIMNKLTKKCLREGVYISPEIKSVEIKAEGPLCVSFGPANVGFMIEDATADDWGTL